MKIKDILGEEGEVTPGTIEAPPQNGQIKIKTSAGDEITADAGAMKIGPDGKKQVTVPATNAGDQVDVVKSDQAQPTEAGEQQPHQIAPNATDSDLPHAPTMGSNVEPDPKAQQANDSAAADNSGAGMNPDEGYNTDLIRSGHNHPIGGNPTDRYIHQVSDHEIKETPAFGTPEYWAKVQSGEIKMNPAPMPTVPVKPSALNDPGMAAPYTPNPRFKDPGMAAPSDWASKAKANESADDILLDKMLTIAGLR
jgi:hypothetical protein